MLSIVSKHTYLTFKQTNIPDHATSAVNRHLNLPERTEETREDFHGRGPQPLSTI